MNYNDLKVKTVLQIINRRLELKKCILRDINETLIPALENVKADDSYKEIYKEFAEEIKESAYVYENLEDINGNEIISEMDTYMEEAETDFYSDNISATEEDWEEELNDIQEDLDNKILNSEVKAIKIKDNKVILVIDFWGALA